MTQASERGISLVGAIFLITVIALLTVALTKSVATTAAATSADIHRMHALLAAELGAQVGAYSAIGPTGSPTCTNTTVQLDAFNLPACDAQITCRSELVLGERYYSIESEGICMDGSNVAAQRSVLMRLQEV